MGKIQESILINASPRDVFDYLDDVARRGHHMLGMGRNFRSEVLSQNATGAGATYRWRGTMYGAKFLWTEVVTRWVRDKEKLHHSTEAKGWIRRIDMGWSVSSAEGGALVTETMDYDLGYSFIGKLADRLWAERYCRNGIRTDFEQMRAELEKPKTVADGGQLAAEVIA